MWACGRILKGELRQGWWSRLILDAFEKTKGSLEWDEVGIYPFQSVSPMVTVHNLGIGENRRGQEGMGW